MVAFHPTAPFSAGNSKDPALVSANQIARNRSWTYLRKGPIGIAKIPKKKKVYVSTTIAKYSSRFCILIFGISGARVKSKTAYPGESIIHGIIFYLTQILFY